MDGGIAGVMYLFLEGVAAVITMGVLTAMGGGFYELDWKDAGLICIASFFGFFGLTFL